jgi:putative heme-binding domain-containing protein
MWSVCCLILLVCSPSVSGQAGKPKPEPQDAKNRSTNKAAPPEPAELLQYGIYEKTSRRAAPTTPSETILPLTLKPGTRIALVGNTLFERAQWFGHFETLLHQAHPNHHLVLRNLAWSADTPNLQPRPANFADLHQHLTHEAIDLIFVAYGFNESFAGQPGIRSFQKTLTAHVQFLRSHAFNGRHAAKVVLLSPTPNYDRGLVDAGRRNNGRLKQYSAIIRQVAVDQKTGFIDLFSSMPHSTLNPWTINGVHLNEAGYATFADHLFRGTFASTPPRINDRIRRVVVDKNRQFFRRYRPLNTFYYTGGRAKSYGYLDFLPAMRNFDVMVANRERRIWDMANGKTNSTSINDNNVPPLPETKQSRGANRWISATEELAEFKIDPRFEVNLFAGEEEFPEIAAPVQMRWDSQGRLWVSCSTTYPHVYPGNEPNDKLVILEDTDGDGKADKSTVFADDLHIPLSFEFGDGGVYVSEMPNLTFIKDTDGDGKADFRQMLLSGFGTEDSHHALHDFSWTPDGDLIFRESIFHHSQVETPYGPVRQQNSGWFRFEPATHRLTSFGTYHSTNPWGVTFDDWGQHVASHPIYAAAFHSLDPPYPRQHPKPAGLRAYSGTAGQEFVDFSSFPTELQGGFIKARYKPTNRIEIHRWKEYAFGYDEEYVGDLIFSPNLSFIPVDIRFGPRGALYVCDWYNPIKGHAQYSLRDKRRDRHSGRIWRITAKGRDLVEPPSFGGAVDDLLDILKRPEYRYRYWAKRELRMRNSKTVARLLDQWVDELSADDPRFRHHQLEAIWTYRTVGATNSELLIELLACEDRHARAAAVEQLRYWHSHLANAIDLLRLAANDPNGIVRMQAVIAATYIGSADALDAVLDVLNHPSDQHLAYAIRSALGSASLRQHWEGNPKYDIGRMLSKVENSSRFQEPTPNAVDAQFDSQQNLKLIKLSCIPERMLFTVDQFAVTTGQPVKIVFTNPDATDHNLVIVRPGALEEVGMAANAMARDPKFANSDFIPAEKQSLILHAAPMIGPTRKSLVHVLRFQAPTVPGIYPFVCTFPGHWVIMKGAMVVANDLKDVEAMLAAEEPQIVREWRMTDFDNPQFNHDEQTVMQGMQAFMKARCHQCHAVAGHGVNLGPDLRDVAKRFRGRKLLEQLVAPSIEINPKYQTTQFLLVNGKVISGVIIKETSKEFHLITNLLTPEKVMRLKKSSVDETIPSKISPMPAGLLNVLTKEEIHALVGFLESGGFELPDHLKHNH